MRKRKRESASDERSATERPGMTPTDIQQKEFRLAFRGYNERDVDEFLDQLTEELAGHIEENRRLRGQASLGGTSAGTDDASREAQAILAKARAEAGRVVREAEERAAMVGAGGIDTRAVVAPYLSRERDFLQSLGQLVQGHAETIRGMVQTHREWTEPSVQPAPTSREAVVVATEPSEAATSTPEPEPGTAAEPVSSERQRSLRELFWGED
jgi:DivIVA domain-containing protein